MAQTIQVYKWNPNENYSDNFSFETKYYDLGSSSLLKTIYSISLTLGVDGGYGTSLPISIVVAYRTNINKNWSDYSTFLIGTQLELWANLTESLTITKKIPVRRIPGIQLKIYGTASENFILNDLSIEYRHIRKKAVGRPE